MSLVIDIESENNCRYYEDEFADEVDQKTPSEQYASSADLPRRVMDARVPNVQWFEWGLNEVENEPYFLRQTRIL